MNSAIETDLKKGSAIQKGWKPLEYKIALVTNHQAQDGVVQCKEST